jgi:hypothetical protein
MDLWINSLIQSPLVRTLARTKGKSQSFTHNIPDNVPPASFSKIVLSAQNSGDNKFGRNYKIKIPQYGYLRDVILKFTVRENVIHDAVVGAIDELFGTSAAGGKATTTFCLDHVQVGDSYKAAGTPTASSHRSALNLSWYNLQRGAFYKQTINTLAGNLSVTSTKIDTKAQEDLMFLAPQLDRYFAATDDGTNTQTSSNSAASLQNGVASIIFGAENQTTSVPATSCNFSYDTDTGHHQVVTPLSTCLKLNGNPKLWSKVMSFYYNIYQLTQNSKGLAYPSISFGSGSVTPTTYKVAKMIWEQLKNEPQQVVSQTIYKTLAISGSTGAAASLVLTGAEDLGGEVTATKSTADTLKTGITSETSASANITLPPYITTVVRGGETFWVPKIPQLYFDDMGNCVGVDFVPLYFVHPNDDATQVSQTQISLLSSDSNNKPKNARKFEFSDDEADRDTWNMWDWQTESQYYPGFAANIAERVTLSTHNKPIQTIFPQETYARIQRMSQAERYRYLKMMDPTISKSGSCNGSDTGRQGEKVLYLPVFLSSTENPSYNFDTRFVEQLDIDVNVNQMNNIYVSTDTTKQEGVQNAIVGISDWIGQYRDTIFSFAWTQSGTSTASAVVTTSGPTLYALEQTAAALNYSDAYTTYVNLRPRNYVLWLRTFDTVPDNYINVEALAFYHNFHDATAQAIRDSNYKPETPANLLQYNTYMESEKFLSADDLQNTRAISIPITTNNLVFGTTLMVRRRLLGSNAQKRDHYFQTLPLKSITLTASGQQIYQSVLDENVLTDCWDFDLATGKVGRKYNNAVSIQSRIDPISGESCYFYYIPYSFSSDMTYNSGCLAFQTLNNPILTIEVNVGTGATAPFDIVPVDSEWTVQVFHNYFNMLRIDSNTGAITRSLDL